MALRKEGFQSARVFHFLASLILLPWLLLVLPAQAEIETVTYIHTDHLGSPILATDQDGNVVWEQDYGPWGEPLQTGAPRDVSYTGHFEEGELGLIYAGARWYDPEVGRFLSPDAVGFQQGGATHFHRYVYGVNQAPDFIVSPGGTAFPVPKGATGPTPVISPAGNQTGVAFTGGAGGANGKVSTMRIMNPTPARGNSPGYPSGYVKYENSASPRPQGVDPYSGKTQSNSTSHYPID